MVEDGDVDLAFPVVPVVERLVRTKGVSDPYFMAHQRLLVPGDSDTDSIEDLSGRGLRRWRPGDDPRREHAEPLGRSDEGP